MKKLYDLDSPFQCIRAKALEEDYKRRRRKRLFDNVKNGLFHFGKSVKTTLTVVLYVFLAYILLSFAVSCIFPGDAWIQKFNFFWYYASLAR